MVVVVKYRRNFDYPHPFGGRISITIHRKEIIDYPNIELDGLSNDMRTRFIYIFSKMFHHYDIFTLDEIRLFKNKSEMK